jgi:hypothetical protein
MALTPEDFQRIEARIRPTLAAYLRNRRHGASGGDPRATVKTDYDGATIASRNLKLAIFGDATTIVAPSEFNDMVDHCYIYST